MKRWMMPLAMLACAAAMPAKAQNQGAFSTSYTLEYELKYDRAAEVIKGLAESGHEFARLRLGWLAYLAGRYNEALDHYNLVLRSNPNSLDGRLGLTLPLMAQKRWQDASDQIRQVLAMSPWDYTAHARLLVCQEALKQWSALEQHAREISAVWGSDANALVYLARAPGTEQHGRGQAGLRTGARAPATACRGPRLHEEESLASGITSWPTRRPSCPPRS